MIIHSIRIKLGNMVYAKYEQDPNCKFGINQDNIYILRSFLDVQLVFVYLNGLLKFGSTNYNLIQNSMVPYSYAGLMHFLLLFLFKNKL